MESLTWFFAFLTWFWVIVITISVLIGAWCGFVILFGNSKEVENG